MDRDEPTAPQYPNIQYPNTTGAPALPAPPPVPGSVWTPPPAGSAPGHSAAPGYSAGDGLDGNQGYVPPAGVGPVGPVDQQWTAPPPAPAPRRRRIARAAVSAAAVVALVGGGAAIGAAVTADRTMTGTGSAAAVPNSDTLPNQQFPGFGQGVTPGGDAGTGTGDGTGSSGTGSAGDGAGDASGGTGTTGTTAAATDEQSVGVVVIDTVLGYQDAQAAGTGMVVSSDGTVLTNNHVVAGSTSIRATVVSTGRTYNATVVGTDATADVAVIKLTGASGLSTVSTDTTSNIAAGTSVVAVGNAGGTGSLTAATGTVTATGRSITATDESGSNAEDLTGLLQTDAAIEAGDSGGPLFDTDGDVIGINTAAATSRSGATLAGYAIPIDDAITIARQILAGQETDTVTIGLPAFLGVSLSAGTDGDAAGVVIAGVVADLPAADAGLTAGDTITALDGRQVNSADGLGDVMAGLDPGQTVSISWTTAAGQTRTGSVTLVEGPAA